VKGTHKNHRSVHIDSLIKCPLLRIPNIRISTFIVLDGVGLLGPNETTARCVNKFDMIKDIVLVEDVAEKDRCKKWLTNR